MIHGRFQKSKVFGAMIALVALLGLQTQAEILVENIDGVSNWSPPAGMKTAIMAFGGLAGPLCAFPELTSTCDNCDQVVGLKKCNRKRVHPDLTIKILFRSDVGSGIAALLDYKGKIVTLGTGTVSAGEPHTLQMTWRELCHHKNVPGMNCELLSQSFRSYLHVAVLNPQTREIVDSKPLDLIAYTPGEGIASDLNFGCDTLEEGNRGICNYGLWRQADRIRITPVYVNPGFPFTDHLMFTKALFQVSEVNFPCSANEGKTFEIPIILKDNGESILSEPILEGLERDKRFFFRVSTEDEAGNIANFMADSVLRQRCGTRYSC
ncbi:MAG: hypothetical protein KDD22_06130, partial [Bdellovibrionales bacterium]|nr:hypothetical protein [Bdellovibrionales bacterium]